MDLVSSLPEEVLCRILSFLTTKEAALTSVLSKRWLTLWTLVPNLDVDDSVFLHPEEGKREREGILQSFMDFVDRALALQGDSPIKRFSLKCRTDDCGDACGCVSREDKGRSLVSCPVKKIEIRGFEITVPEMKTIRHLLESLPCLKEMKIYAEEDNDPTNLEVLREYELIEMAMKYYGQLFKCDASFIRPGSL